jgi:uncharacterized cupin superfamily protein
MSNRVLQPADLVVQTEHLPADQVVTGAPAAGAVALDVPELPQVEIGVWEHTAGGSTDVEADEVFVVLSGRATVEIEDGPTLELRPGSLGVLASGARTTWRVHETLRKVYVTPR